MLMDNKARMALVYLMVVFDVTLMYIINNKLTANKFRMDVWMMLGAFVYVLAYLIIIDPKLMGGKANTNILLRIIPWLLFVSCLSAFMNQTIRYLRVDQDEINNAFLTTVCIFVLFSGFAFANVVSESKMDSIAPYMILALFGIIIARIILFFTTDGDPRQQSKSSFSTRNVISYVVILIFTFFVMYDTQKCKIGETAMQRNVISCSNGLFLNALNIFDELLRISSGGE